MKPLLFFLWAFNTVTGIGVPLVLLITTMAFRRRARDWASLLMIWGCVFVILSVLLRISYPFVSLVGTPDYTILTCWLPVLSNIAWVAFAVGFMAIAFRGTKVNPKKPEDRTTPRTVQ